MNCWMNIQMRYEVLEGKIKKLAGDHMRALMCIDDIAMHCADGAINDENKLYRIRAALLKVMRYAFDAEDPACVKFCENAAAKLA